jgi:hypothetical protein
MHGHPTAAAASPGCAALAAGMSPSSCCLQLKRVAVSALPPQEPYQASGQAEDCVVANFSQAFDGDGAGGAAWGWSDEPCSERHVLMCRTMGEGLHVQDHVQNNG